MDQSAELRRLARANGWLNQKVKELNAEVRAQIRRAEAAERAVRSQRIELDDISNRLRDQRR